MVKSLHFAALAVVLAAQAGDASCQGQGSEAPLIGVCEVDTRGVQVSPDGRYVTDVITPRCQVRPEEHRIEAWLEYSTSMWGGWTMPRSPARSSVIPDQTGFPVYVSLKCKQGYYRAAWRTIGRGPALPDNPQGVSFDKLDGDAGSTHIDATQCEGDGS